MAKEQPNVGDLLPLLESSDLQQLEEIKGLINEHLNTERGSVLLNSLVDYYLETSSSQAVQILVSVREPHDKHLLDKMNEALSKQPCRLPTLTLLGHVVRKQPSWIHKIARLPLLNTLLKCLKADTDVVVLITGVLVLITLLPMIPQPGKQHLYEFFDVFGRLAGWNVKHPGHVTDVYLIHLHATVYSLFHRLYGMYPCNFVSYLRSHYSMKENCDTFEEVVKPMLEHVRIHPELVTGTKDHELDPTRWKRFEVHDIVIECAKVSLDPKEASYEEGYSTMPEHFSAHLQLRPLDCTTSPYTDLHSSYGSSSSTQYSTPRQPLSLPMPPLSGTQPPQRSPQTSRQQSLNCESSCEVKDPIWSPSSHCGMTTPPTRLSPTADQSQNAPHPLGRAHSISGGKRTPSSAIPAASSPPPSLPDYASLPASVGVGPPRKEDRPTESSKPLLLRQEPISEQEKDSSEMTNGRDGAVENVKNMTLTELSAFMKEQELDLQQRPEKEGEEDAITEELLQITEEKREASGLRGFDSPFYRTTETLTGAQEKLLATSTPGLTGEPQNATSTPDKAEAPPWAGGGGVAGGGASLDLSFQPVFTPIDHPLRCRFPRCPSAPEEEAAGLFTPSPCGGPAPGPAYEPLFDLALPKVAPLFVGRRTTEAARRARGRKGGEEEEAGDGMAASSPLEVLDRLIQQGNDVHDKVLKRLPLPSKSADWTHFGGKQQSIKAKGSAPLDELHTLRSQLLLLHNQLLYERYKREQHAVRNRRLLRRIINATALEEQNHAMKDQLKLQDLEAQCLQASLQAEQRRYRQLWDDRETMVTRLHSQIRQLQQGRDEYYTKTQELQSKLQEYQKRTGELEAELQKANNKVCNTGHQLNQLSVKLTSSETVQQQMAALNKQLLLLGEVNRLCVEELQHLGPNSNKEAHMVQASSVKDVEKLHQSLAQQGQRLEAAQQRIGDLESQLAKKEHLIVEQKKFLEDVKSQAREQLQASESRYQAQRRVTQVLQTELLQLYSRLEMESPAACNSPAGGAESFSSTDSRLEECGTLGLGEQVKGDAQGGATTNSSEPLMGNGSTLSPGKPQAGAAAANVNGSQEPLPLLLDPPRLLCPPASTSFTVGSYPSAKSFLGMRSRELFRNKSESQCEEEEEPPRLAGLSQGLKTEQCVETAESPAPGSAPTKDAHPDAQQRANNRGGGGAGDARQRQQQLRIMDYNEAHLEHS
ncbi:TSC complex subunit 1a isoform X1 [Anguilla anguilla]|uniref:TSC complex subunit 1a isoform X1 n=1 Tax=Anguilla anguilla TaxID=7936 RepID=UPI0015B0F012|nr:TSC complex subunit 1a isoform X1 [Anguilla anguilla]XP_035291376.1 TSC complex subunit 1a isoform X1 [Anguilla anguilla]